MELCKSNIEEITRLLIKSAYIACKSEKSSDRNLARLCNLMAKKLSNKLKDDMNRKQK